MEITGVNLHARQQTIAMLDTDGCACEVGFFKSGVRRHVTEDQVGSWRTN
jgi:hypothetical protein